jgi:hypothetical protein
MRHASMDETILQMPVNLKLLVALQNPDAAFAKAKVLGYSG